jgi:hypothetical protein
MYQSAAFLSRTDSLVAGSTIVTPFPFISQALTVAELGDQIIQGSSASFAERDPKSILQLELISRAVENQSFPKYRTWNRNEYIKTEVSDERSVIKFVNKQLNNYGIQERQFSELYNECLELASVVYRTGCYFNWKRSIGTFRILFRHTSGALELEKHRDYEIVTGLLATLAGSLISTGAKGKDVLDTQIDSSCAGLWLGNTAKNIEDRESVFHSNPLLIHGDFRSSILFDYKEAGKVF